MQLDRTSPIPLVQQIVIGLRYQIATGRLGAGALLPSCRVAAAEWSVHMHTVRKAYRELADAGLIRLEGRRRAMVGDRVHPRGADSLDQLTRELVGAARRLFGAGIREIVESLERHRSSRTEASTVSVVECSMTLAEDLAAQVRKRWRVEVGCYLVNRLPEPPSGVILSTYFHSAQLRRAFTHRRRDLAFAHIRLSRTGLRQIVRACASSSPARLYLVETDAALARTIESELRTVLPETTEVEVVLPKDPRAFLRRKPDHAMAVVSPQNWDRLDDEDRKRPLVLPLRYAIDEADVAQLAHREGWRPAGR